ncbi:MAG: hypothetical protein M3P89_05110, partial [Actinomycetota bacterium]|nr:hypothetical protein [Actinomycetota bacterium]
APAADVTYDLNGVVSTAFPSTQHPFNTGTGTPGVRTCVVGGDTMAIPAGTVVDDSACPDNPSTIVWTGGGAYPAPTAGIRVVADRSVWDRAVATWKTTHGHS